MIRSPQHKYKHRKIILPKIPLEKMSLPNLSEDDINSKNSTADITITQRDSYSLQTIPELKVDFSQWTNRDKSKGKEKEEISKCQKKSSRSLTEAQIKVPDILQYLGYLDSLPQNNVKSFEQKLKELNKSKDEKEEEELEKKKKIINLGLDEHLPEDVKQVLFADRNIKSPEKLKVSFFSSRTSLKPVRRFGKERLPSILFPQKEPTDAKNDIRSRFTSQYQSKGFDLFENIEINVQAQKIAEEVTENYQKFLKESNLHKELNRRIQKMIKEDGLTNIFEEKKYRRHPLQIRIYLDMLLNHGLNPLESTKSTFMNTNLTGSRFGSSSKTSGKPILIERKYYAYVRLNDELKQVNIQSKIENINSLENNLIQGYNDYRKKKQSLVKRLVKQDYVKVCELFKVCEEFEKSISKSKADNLLEGINRFEFRKGDFELIHPETRLMNEKINDVLKNWNTWLESYN